MSNKIEKLCEELEIEADLEGNIVKDGDMCTKSLDDFDCTRPNGHLGFHIACGMGANIVVMWKDAISDEQNPIKDRG